MTNITAIILAINLSIALLYSTVFYILKKNGCIARFLIIFLMPVFGLITIILVDLSARNKEYISEELVFDDEDENSDEGIMSFIGTDFLNVLPIAAVLELGDIKEKRRRLFNSINGEYAELFPYLKKALKDRDYEVIHYASAVLTDHMRNINENFNVMKNEYIKNPDDLSVYKKYTEALINLLHWENLNGTTVNEIRKSLKILLDKTASTKIALEEKYFIHKINNEIMLRDFCNALRSGKRFIEEYPESDKPYQSILELWYYSKDPEMFSSTVKFIIKAGMTLSGETYNMVSFWRKHIS